ncbi:hypothetical protein, partial [Infirmifilum sp.]|uniref:hypothetical protein n=1 Tax=Infirmifilum sp. TaxID=2856575 RepID=UPI003D14F2E3
MEVSTRVDHLRSRIRALEGELSKYGFDQRRGIETYKRSEIRGLLRGAGPRAERVRALLKELVETQEDLYQELYRAAGAREIAVDTDTPEMKLREIKNWLEGRREHQEESGNTFTKAVDEVLRAVEEGGGADAVVGTLTELYKRDYDRFRVLDFILMACRRLGIEAEKPADETLGALAGVVVRSVLKANIESVRKLVRAGLRR